MNKDLNVACANDVPSTPSLEVTSAELSSREPTFQQVMSPRPQGGNGLNDDGQCLDHNGSRHTFGPQDHMKDRHDHGESDEINDDGQCLDPLGSRHSFRPQDHSDYHQDQEESDEEEEMEQLQDSILQMQEELVMLRLKRAQKTQQKKLKTRTSTKKEDSRRKTAARELVMTPSSIRMERVVDSTSRGRRHHEVADFEMKSESSDEDEDESRKGE